MRLRHEYHFRIVFPQLNAKTDNKYEATMSQNETNSHPTMTTTTTPTAATSKQSDFNVIESLKEYNRSQTNKISCIDNDTSTLDHDVADDMPQLPEPASVTKTVVLLCLCLVLLLLSCLANSTWNSRSTCVSVK